MTGPDRLGYGSVHDPLRRYRLGGSGHFIFVEEAALVSGHLEDPFGTVIPPDALPGERWRFRASGISSRLFLEVMDLFETLDHETVTEDQRGRRRDQLVEHFGGRPLPGFDLYVEHQHDDLAFLRAVLGPGSWYFAVVDRREDADPRHPVFVGAPGLDLDLYGPGSLDTLEAVQPYVEYRLRDIFSLVHVRDAGMERIGGATPPGAPDMPGGGAVPLETYLRLRNRRLGQWQLPEAEV